MKRKGLLSVVFPGTSGAEDGGQAVCGGQPNVDYPQAGEKVQRGHYSIRISGCTGECQAAIDDGDWQNCRAADGFSWYDWAPEQPGTHRIAVRVRIGNKWVKAQRSCRVV